MTKLRSLTNFIERTAQSDFIGDLERVTLEELQAYSDPKNVDNQRLVIGKLSTGQVTCACVIVRWTCSKTGKHTAGMNALAVDASFQKIGSATKLGTFVQNEYERLGVEMTDGFVIAPADGRAHGSSVMIDWSTRHGVLPVKIDELLPGTDATLRYFDDYKEKSVYYKEFGARLKEGIQIHCYEVLPMYLK